MTDEERNLISESRLWIDKVESVHGAFDGTSHPRLCLPPEADRHLRNLAEAIAECENILQTFAGRIDASKEALNEIAGRPRKIHQRLDDVVLPARLLDE